MGFLRCKGRFLITVLLPFLPEEGPGEQGSPYSSSSDCWL